MKIYYIMTMGKDISIALMHMKFLASRHDIYPILTPNFYQNRKLMFIKMSIMGNDLIKRIGKITKNPINIWWNDPHLPKEDKIIIRPATFNTMNKIALGIADNKALTLIHSAIGRKIPIELYPCLSSGLEKHPIIDNTIALLKELGIKIK